MSEKLSNFQYISFSIDATISQAGFSEFMEELRDKKVVLSPPTEYSTSTMHGVIFEAISNSKIARDIEVVYERIRPLGERLRVDSIENVLPNYTEVVIPLNSQN